MLFTWNHNYFIPVIFRGQIHYVHALSTCHNMKQIQIFVSTRIHI